MAKTALKVISGIFILLLLLILLGIFLISRVDPNEYIPQIQDQARQHLGSTLELESIEWGFWPSLQLKLTGLKLSTQAEQHSELIAMNDASLSVQVLPLLSNSLVVDHVILDSSMIYFHQYADGSHNWNPLLEKLQSSPKTPDTAEEPSSMPPFDISVNQIELKNGQIQVTGTTTASLSDLNLTISDIKFGQAIPVLLTSKIKYTDSASKANFAFDVSLDSDIILDQEMTRFEVKELLTKIQGPKNDQTLELKGNAFVNLQTMAIESDLTLAPINLDAWMAMLPASEQGPSTSTKPSDAPAKPTPLPKEMLQGLDIKTRLNLEKVTYKGAPHSLKLEAHADKGVIDVSKLNVNAYSGSAQGSMNLDVNKSPATLSLKLDVDNMAMGQILQTWLNTQPISGTLESTIAVQSKGDTVEALIDGLRGDSGISMTQATLPKINLHEMVWSHLQQKQGTLVQVLNEFPKLKQDLGTLKTPKIVREKNELDQLLAQFKISPDTIQSQNITASLNDQPLDFQFSYGRKTEVLTLNTALKLPFENPDLANIVWPLTCKGGLAGNFGCSVNTDALKPILKNLAKNEAKARLREELAPHEEKARQELKEAEDKAKAKLEEKVGNKVNESLKGLFKQRQEN